MQNLYKLTSHFTVDEHGNVKILPSPLTPLKGSKVKYLNFVVLRQLSIFFAEILHACRGAIDMKHTKQDFGLMAWSNPLGWT